MEDLFRPPVSVGACSLCSCVLWGQLLSKQMCCHPKAARYPGLHTAWWKQGSAVTRHRVATPCHLVPHHVALLPQVFTISVSLHCFPVPSEDVSRDDLWLTTIYLQAVDSKACNKVPLLISHKTLARCSADIQGQVSWFNHIHQIRQDLLFPPLLQTRHSCEWAQWLCAHWSILWSTSLAKIAKEYPPFLLGD